MPRLWPSTATKPVVRHQQPDTNHSPTFHKPSPHPSRTPPPPPLPPSRAPSSSSTTASPPPPTEKRPRRVELIVKLGGSALTSKTIPHTIHDARFQTSLDTVARLHHTGIGLLVIHGAGSFGHFEASHYNLASGAASALGVSATHASVATLNSHVVNGLIARNVPAVGVSPLLVPGRTRVDFIAALLDRGHLPVLHGDGCYAGDGRTAIISGDALVASLCIAFPFVNRAVFLSDVDGLFKHPPHNNNNNNNNNNNEIIQTVVVNELGECMMMTSGIDEINENGQRVRRKSNPYGNPTRNINKNIETTYLHHDTTGGMTGKVLAAAKCATDSGGRVTAFIARVGSQAAEIAMANRPDRSVTSKCTRICFQPDGGLPLFTADDVSTGHSSAPLTNGSGGSTVSAGGMEHGEHDIGFGSGSGGEDVIVEGNKKSKGRHSLPKRGSGLAERTRRRGWFT